MRPRRAAQSVMENSSQPATPRLFEKWREADAVARAAEKDVLTASLDALDGKGAPPSVDDRERARRLRATADGMLQFALVALGGSAERPGRGDGEHPSSRPAS
jgi:hypothetical protein